jgi:hypothetical protein
MKLDDRTSRAWIVVLAVLTAAVWLYFIVASMSDTGRHVLVMDALAIVLYRLVPATTVAFFIFAAVRWRTPKSRAGLVLALPWLFLAYCWIFLNERRVISSTIRMKGDGPRETYQESWPFSTYACCDNGQSIHTINWPNIGMFVLAVALSGLIAFRITRRRKD